MDTFQPTQPPSYDPLAVQPLRDELTAVGFAHLISPDDVDKALDRKDDKTVLVVLNSVCGCAGGSARPGVMKALQAETIPDELVTLFAGMEKDAVDHFRAKYLAGHHTSSPCIALFRNGEAVEILHRQQIEGRTDREISYELIQIFVRECSKEGPSVSAEELEKAFRGEAICGKEMPRYNG